MSRDGNRRLAVEPLTRVAFAPWGTVIERAGAEVRSINEGTTDRLHALATADVGGGRAILSIFAGRPRPAPLRIAMLERHPLGSQSFFPLQPWDWLVVVGTPMPGAAPALRCFRAGGDQGVQYAPGAWHHPLLVLQGPQEFLVVDRDGPGANCEEVAFEDTSFFIDGIGSGTAA